MVARRCIDCWKLSTQGKDERQRDEGEVQAKNVVADVDELPGGGYTEASLLLYSNPMMHGTYSVTQIALFLVCC